MKLSETIDLMNSKDYKDRLKAEYFQLKIRIEGLEAMLKAWEKGTPDFCPTAPKILYDKQLVVMREYLRILEKRAEADGIKFNEDK